ncbi:MAG: NADH-quinone oxidoreductase subunit L [Deltaproteobacteria bacterium]|jgi:ech hydrogenase subunit A|nr:NADH-quinone oxidoreductase subunit L [Deltaproteobacteria bacterium]
MLDMLIFGCVVFPFLAALYLWLCPLSLARKSLPPVIAIIALSAIGLALTVRKGGAVLENYVATTVCGISASPLVAFLDFALLFAILYLAWRHRHTLALILVAAQIAGLAVFDAVLMRNAPEGVPLLLRFDSLSVVMVCVISLVGGVICYYALGYMREHEEHLHLAVSRQPQFYAVLTLFLGAMNGLVLADNLGWIYFFWEITTLCSFLLIGHDKTALAIQNALRALWMNMAGGVAFLLAIMILQDAFGTLSIQLLMDEATPAVVFLLPMALLCIGGFTKSALTPFQSWLCGAMVAPTPVSALLHSSTMVKAGVYLLLRLSPMFIDTALGIGVAIFGAFTFFVTSALAVGQSNAKRVLAYSTIANLGLIASCAGMGTEMAISAGILCIIFHAISKGLLFLCVGSIEQRIGSRDIEDMRGLVQRMPKTANITVLGIMTMMLPPFGMLLCKWMAIEAATAVPGGTVLLILLLALGSALTVLFWARFAGILLGYNTQGPRPATESQDCTIMCSLRVLAGAALVFSLLSPFLYQAVMGDAAAAPASSRLFAAGWLPLTVYPLFAVLGLGWLLASRAARRQADQPMGLPYLSGIQAVRNGEAGFIGPMDAFVVPKASNYYLSHIFGEERIEPVANTVALTLLALLLGGMLL